MITEKTRYIRTHFFDEGGHGFDLVTEIHPLKTWPELARQWLSDIPSMADMK